MPRKSRIDAPGAVHHIITRGIERREIFKDNEDQKNFIERLGYSSISEKALWLLCEKRNFRGEKI